MQKKKKKIVADKAIWVEAGAAYDRVKARSAGTECCTAARPMTE